MAFGGRRFIKQCTDQLSVGVSGERYFGEEGRLGWSVVWEDAVPLYGMTIGKTKMGINQVMALDGRHRLLST